MIDPNIPKPIRFSRDDVPELAEIPDFNIEAEREAERQRREENHLWLETHMGFQPFGDIW